MSRQTRSLVSYVLLDLCKSKPLEKIRTTELIEKSGISRQTFYKNFRDKEDVICSIYHDMILADWDSEDRNQKYYEGCVDFYRRMTDYSAFLMQACSITGQNCLCDYMRVYSLEWETKQLTKLYGDPLPAILTETVRYHSSGSMTLCIDWILDGMKTSPEINARYITDLRKSILESDIIRETLASVT